MIGWKINQLGLVNLTNILVDMYVLYFAYISSKKKLEEIVWSPYQPSAVLPAVRCWCEPTKLRWRKLFGRHINPQLFYQPYVDDANQQKSVGGSCLVVIQSPQPFYQEDIGDTNQHVAITIKLVTDGNV